MAKARDLKRRIRSVDNTRQITKTMEMVAASKLKRSQDRVVAARPFDEFLRDVIGQLHAGIEASPEDFPLLRERGESGRVTAASVRTGRMSSPIASTPSFVGPPQVWTSALAAAPVTSTEMGGATTRV